VLVGVAEAVAVAVAVGVAVAVLVGVAVAVAVAAAVAVGVMVGRGVAAGVEVLVAVALSVGVAAGGSVVAVASCVGTGVSLVDISRPLCLQPQAASAAARTQKSATCIRDSFVRTGPSFLPSSIAADAQDRSTLWFCMNAQQNG